MEARLFPEGTVPEWTTPEWYAGRDRAPHVDEELHRPRLLRAASLVRELVAETGARYVVDLGAGDGGLLSLLGDLDAWGYDLQPSNVVGARERGVLVIQDDVLTDEIEWGDVVVATEMLEHLVDPHGFIAGFPPLVRGVVASSPWTETVDSHYGYHTFCWDMAGYRALFEDLGWHVVDHVQVGMFQVLSAVRCAS